MVEVSISCGSAIRRCEPSAALLAKARNAESPKRLSEGGLSRRSVVARY